MFFFNQAHKQWSRSRKPLPTFPVQYFALYGNILLSIYRNVSSLRRVFPVMSYGIETWPLTMSLIRKLKVTQSAMGRAMRGISLRKHIRMRSAPELTSLKHEELPDTSGPRISLAELVAKGPKSSRMTSTDRKTQCLPLRSSDDLVKFC